MGREAEDKFYQLYKSAGFDGQPSRSILLHCPKTHLPGLVGKAQRVQILAYALCPFNRPETQAGEHDIKEGLSAYVLLRGSDELSRTRNTSFFGIILAQSTGSRPTC